MTSRIEEAYDFNNRHGHFGLIRDGEAELKAASRRVMMADELPEVDYDSLPRNGLNVESWLQIENQASQGSCQGHMLTSCCEVAIYRETQGQVVQLNRQFAYIASQMEDGIVGDRGSTLSGGISAAKKRGLPLEELWPYTGQYNRNIPQACYDDAQNRKLRLAVSCPSYDFAMRWLVHGIGCPGQGIGWNQYSVGDAQGKVERYKSGGGGHALAIVDWTFKFSYKGKPYLKRPNSWGKEYSQGGYDFIHPDVFDAYCQYETVFCYSDMDGDAIAPRPFDFSMI